MENDLLCKLCEEEYGKKVIKISCIMCRYHLCLPCFIKTQDGRCPQCRIFISTEYGLAEVFITKIQYSQMRKKKKELKIYNQALMDNNNLLKQSLDELQSKVKKLQYDLDESEYENNILEEAVQNLKCDNIVATVNGKSFDSSEIMELRNINSENNNAFSEIINEIQQWNDKRNDSSSSEIMEKILEISQNAFDGEYYTRDYTRESSDNEEIDEYYEESQPCKKRKFGQIKLL